MEQKKRKLSEDLKKFDPSLIKAVAIDIDGTLINDKAICTPRTEKAVKDLIASGREVYIVTGRGTATAMSFAKQIGLPKYMINYNGASVWNFKTEQREYTDYISVETAPKLVEIIRKHDVLAFLYSDDNLHYERDHALLSQYLERAQIASYKINFDEIEAGSFQKFFIMGAEDVIYKLAEDIKRAFKADLSWFLTTPGLHNATQKNDPALCLEIMQKGVNKGVGLERLLKAQNISMEEVVAFGDDSNDIEMLEMVGWGIAMDNAQKTVKKVSNAQTLSHIDDGVAYFIEEYLL